MKEGRNLVLLSLSVLFVLWLLSSLFLASVDAIYAPSVLLLLCYLDRDDKEMREEEQRADGEVRALLKSGALIIFFIGTGSFEEHTTRQHPEEHNITYHNMT